MIIRVDLDNAILIERQSALCRYREYKMYEKSSRAKPQYILQPIDLFTIKAEWLTLKLV